MKSIKEISKSFNPTQHKEEIIIDDFAKNIVNKVFGQLSRIFPAWQYNWKTQKEIDGAKIEWTKAFNENGINTLDQIKHGFVQARNANTDFLPSCGKFIHWCNPSPESLGWPTNDSALRDCIKYRNDKKLFGDQAKYCRPLIIELCKRVDWFLMNTVATKQEQQKATLHFGEVYIDLLNSGYTEPQESNDLRLPTEETVKDGMSEQQKADKQKRDHDRAKGLKNLFKRNKE